MLEGFYRARRGGLFNGRGALGLAFSQGAAPGTDPGYPLPPGSVSDLSADLPPLWPTRPKVRLLAGLYGSSALVPIPQGRELVGAVGSLVKLTTGSAALRVTELTGTGATLRNVQLDANLAAREAAGFASYTHGSFSLNVDGPVWEDVTATNYGETVAAADLLNTCAIVIDSDHNQVGVVSGGVIRRCVANDAALKAPYGFRLRSEFIGFARGEIPGLSLCIIEDSTIFGTIKNAIELAGPNCFGHIVRRNVLRNFVGQGGFETDYGAYNCLFEDNDVGHPGTDNVISKSVSAYSFRASDQGDGKLKEGSGNTFRRNRAHHFISAGALFFRAFHLISCRDSVLEANKVDSIVRGPGAGPLQNIGVYLETNYGEIHDILLRDQEVEAGDVGIQISGANPVSGITVQGGHYRVQSRGYWEPTGTPLSGVLFTGGVELTADVPAFLASGRATPVSFFDGAVLRGNRLALNGPSTAAQFKNTKFVLPPKGKSDLELSLPGITSINGNSYERMPPGEAYLLRHADILYDAAKRAAYQACLDGLLADGIYDKLDVLMVLAAPFAATSLQNALQDRYNASVVGAPTFTAGQGYSGADTSKYLQLAYNPAAETHMHTRDAGFMALWKGAGTSVLTRAGTSNVRISTRANLAIDWRPNMLAATTATAAQDFKMAWWTRPDAAKFSHGYDGVTVGTDVAGASEALTSTNVLIGATGGTSSAGDGLHKALAIGGYLTIAEKEQLRTRVDALLTALAA